MPMFVMNPDGFRSVDEASFADLKVKERGDLQRLLRTQIDVLGDDLYVLAEEFSDWEDSRLRIDLLAIDKNANLVVIELKRSNDGGHMELQAIRYASMVSAMTFERAVQIHAAYLPTIGQPADEAQGRILTFLDWDSPNEEPFAEDVRIVLVSQDFGKELTTTVLWLREYDIDIRCIRLRPYKDGDKLLIDVQQVIPLPEAVDYQVRLREKEQEGRKERIALGDVHLRFWTGLVAVARSRNTRHAHIKPSSYHWLGSSSGVPGLGLNYVIVKEYGVVELYIDRGEKDVNKRIFAQLESKKDAIAAAFPGELVWEPLEDKRACRIKHIVATGGYRSPEKDWPAIHTAMVDAMTNFEKALKPALDSLAL